MRDLGIVDDHLDDAARITQIKECHATVIAATGNPPRQCHHVADIA